MNYEQLVRKINSAGAWFIGSFMGEFVINYPKFCDDQDKRNEFAEYIQAEYGKAWIMNTPQQEQNVPL